MCNYEWIDCLKIAMGHTESDPMGHTESRKIEI